MIKILKENIKLIIAFILGGILIGGITVYAVINASDINYENNKTVANALDDLYTRASTYKNLNQTTTASTNDIVSGKTAYNSNGNLITGTSDKIFSQEEYDAKTGEGTYWKSETGLKTSSDGILTLNIGFEPEKVYIFGERESPSKYAYANYCLYRKVGFRYKGFYIDSIDSAPVHESGLVSNWVNYSYADGVMTLGGWGGVFLSATYSYVAYK